MNRDDESMRNEPNEHTHYVNEYSVVKWNGGNPVYVCGHDKGECRIIVCYAVPDETNTWRPGPPYR